MTKDKLAEDRHQADEGIISSNALEWGNGS